MKNSAAAFRRGLIFSGVLAGIVAASGWSYLWTLGVLSPTEPVMFNGEIRSSEETINSLIEVITVPPSPPSTWSNTAVPHWSKTPATFDLYTYDLLKNWSDQQLVYYDVAPAAKRDNDIYKAALSYTVKPPEHLPVGRGGPLEVSVKYGGGSRNKALQQARIDRPVQAEISVSIDEGDFTIPPPNPETVVLEHGTSFTFRWQITPKRLNPQPIYINVQQKVKIAGKDYVNHFFGDNGSIDPNSPINITVVPTIVARIIDTVERWFGPLPATSTIVGLVAAIFGIIAGLSTAIVFGRKVVCKLFSKKQKAETGSETVEGIVASETPPTPQEGATKLAKKESDGAETQGRNQSS